MIGVIANVLIAAGLIFEYVIIGRAITVNAEAQRENDKTVAAAVERAARADLETQKLKSQFSWRALHLETIGKLIPILSATPSKISISYLQSDPDSQALAHQWGAVFKTAGWQVGMEGGTYGGRLWFGILLPAEGDEDISVDAAELVRRALTEAKIGFNIAPIPLWVSAVTSSFSPPIRPLPDDAGSTRMFIGPKQPVMA